MRESGKLLSPNIGTGAYIRGNEFFNRRVPVIAHQKHKYAYSVFFPPLTHSHLEFQNVTMPTTFEICIDFQLVLGANLEGHSHVKRSLMDCITIGQCSFNLLVLPSNGLMADIEISPEAEYCMYFSRDPVVVGIRLTLRQSTMVFWGYLATTWLSSHGYRLKLTSRQETRVRGLLGDMAPLSIPRYRGHMEPYSWAT